MADEFLQNNENVWDLRIPKSKEKTRQNVLIIQLQLNRNQF